MNHHSQLLQILGRLQEAGFIGTRLKTDFTHANGWETTLCFGEGVNLVSSYGKGDTLEEACRQVALPFGEFLPQRVILPIPAEPVAYDPEKARLEDVISTLCFEAEGLREKVGDLTSALGDALRAIGQAYNKFSVLLPDEPRFGDFHKNSPTPILYHLAELEKAMFDGIRELPHASNFDYWRNKRENSTLLDSDLWEFKKGTGSDFNGASLVDRTKMQALQRLEVNWAQAQPMVGTPRAEATEFKVDENAPKTLDEIVEKYTPTVPELTLQHWQDEVRKMAEDRKITEAARPVEESPPETAGEVHKIPSLTAARVLPRGISDFQARSMLRTGAAKWGQLAGPRPEPEVPVEALLPAAREGLNALEEVSNAFNSGPYIDVARLRPIVSGAVDILYPLVTPKLPLATPPAPPVGIRIFQSDTNHVAVVGSKFSHTVLMHAGETPLQCLTRHLTTKLETLARSTPHPDRDGLMVISTRLLNAVRVLMKEASDG